MGNDRLLLRNLGIAAAVVIGVLAFGSIVGNTDENSCMDNVREMADRMEAACQGDYLEWGYDSPEQCTNQELGTLPDCG